MSRHRSFVSDIRLPARLKGAVRIDIGDVSVFTDRLLVANAVAARRNRNRIYGYKMFHGKRVYWVLYGFVNDPNAYRAR